MTAVTTVPKSLFQSTPPARGATWCYILHDKDLNISIHAPREGGDYQYSADDVVANFISIHAPREGGDANIY